MALQSEVSPPIVGDTNKDTKIDGDTKSNDNDESQSTEEEVDLEEGEILDSGEEEEVKEISQSQLKEALDKKCLQSIEKLAASPAKSAILIENDKTQTSSHRPEKKLYLDHDHVDDEDEGDREWYPSPKYKSSSKFNDNLIDYRKELAAYMGSPPSSPERKPRGRDEKSRKKKSTLSKAAKAKKQLRKTIKRKDIKGMRVTKTRKKEKLKRLCKFFKEGKCAKGSDCPFSHSGSPFKKKELCKFYLNGSCYKGKGCLYMHDDFPCKFFHTGSRCYADENCRFSHAPLTEEAKKLLADYLKGYHGNEDDYEGRKRRVSRSPEPNAPPIKRPCILGSPPRHIKEAEETKRWQEEMKLLQQQNQPGFEIHLSPVIEPTSPSQFTKPNFYSETLQNTPSPQKRILITDVSNPIPILRAPPPPAFLEHVETHPSPPINTRQNDGDVNWKNISDLIHKLSAPNDDHIKQRDHTQQEPDFTSDVKFDETTQFSEMESPMDYPVILSPSHKAQSTVDDDEDTTNEEASNQDSPDTQDASGDSMASPKPLPPPIVIPTHLPRKQRELFLRIQQHQRRNAAMASDVSNSPGGTEKSENPEFEKEESEEEIEKPIEKEESKWYSSEDDDDYDTEQQLSNVLKKLRQAPPPQAPSAKPAINIMQMISKITHHEDKAMTDEQHQQGAFWKSILTGAVPPNKVSATPAVASNPPTRRRTLLPDPKITPLEKKDIVVPKDPRLKNRDPRTLASISNKPPGAIKNISDVNIPPTLPFATATPTRHQISDLNSLFPKSSVTEAIKEGVPYRLHGIFAKPPNYMPYIHASQSDPKLLNDPRLRRHIIQGTPGSQANENTVTEIVKEPQVGKIVPIKETPPIPPLLLQYGKPEGKLSINIFETSSSIKTSIDVPKPLESKPPIISRRLSDPRMRRRDSLVDQLSNSGSNTPPHLTIVEPSLISPPLQEFKSAPILESALTDTLPETQWLPPVLEKSWTPPALEKGWSLLSAIKTEPESEIEKTSPPEKTWSLLSTIKIEPESEIEKKSLSDKSWSLSSTIKTEPESEIEKTSPPEKSWSLLSTIKIEPESEIEKTLPPEKNWGLLPTIKSENDSVIEKTFPPELENIQNVPDIKPSIPVDEQSLGSPQCGINLSVLQPPLTITAKKVMPTAASHLPRAIADPRMAKLHHPLDPRRARLAADSSVKSGPLTRNKSAAAALALAAAESSKVFQNSIVKEPIPSVSTDTPEQSSTKEKTVSIPKKRKLSEKSDEKKKTIHRNRKTSMDYASPLNSCDDTNRSKSLGYNSYNQRPKQRTAKPSSGVDSPVLNTSVSLDISETTPISDFLLSDNSNQECDSNDVNLKDMFKTIDPTASPFC